MSRRGKIIKKHTVSVEGADVELVIRMHEDEYGGHRFSAKADEHDLSIWTDENGEVTTVDELIRAAKKKLKEKLSVQWRSMIHISIREQADESNDGWGWNKGRRAGFSYRFIEVGENASGDRVWRSDKHSRIQLTELEEGTGIRIRNSFRTTRSFCLIPDTPEARDGLKAIEATFDALQGKLAEFLSGDRILATLANVATLGLPAPSPDAKATS